MAAPKGRELDTNLNILHAMKRDGVELTTRDIAEICGVSERAIRYVQNSAISKIRRKLKQQGLDYSSFGL